MATVADGMAGAMGAGSALDGLTARGYAAPERRRRRWCTVDDMSAPIVARVTSLVRDFDARVQAAPAASWANAAPCDGWTATDVITHVATNLSRLTAALTQQAPVPFDAADLLPSWNSGRDAFLAALASGDLSTPIPGPVGEMPAEQMIGRFIATDVLIHTWDLARAVGGDERLDPVAVSGAFSGLKLIADGMRGPRRFADAVAPNADDDEQTQFLKFSGRTV